MGSSSTRLSCTVAPAWARKATMTAGATAVPMERTSDRVASAEFASDSLVLASIM